MRRLGLSIFAALALLVSSASAQGWVVQSSYYGTPCRSWSGGMSFMSAYLSRSPGNRLVVQLQQKGYSVWPPVLYVLMVGRRATSIQLGGLPILPGCRLYVQPDVVLFAGKNPGLGISIPMNPKWNGVSLYFQMLLYETSPGSPGGGARRVQAISFSDAAKVSLTWKS